LLQEGPNGESRTSQGDQSVGIGTVNAASVVVVPKKRNPFEFFELPIEQLTQYSPTTIQINSANVEHIVDHSETNSSAETEAIRDLISRLEDFELQLDVEESSNTYACYIIGGFVSLMFFISLILAVWWSVTHNDLSGGFTLGAYILAAAALPTGLASYTHSFHCRCWSRTRRMHKIARD
jgi:hypothetical protein